MEDYIYIYIFVKYLLYVVLVTYSMLLYTNNIPYGSIKMSTCQLLVGLCQSSLEHRVQWLLDVSPDVGDYNGPSRGPV